MAPGSPHLHGCETRHQKRCRTGSGGRCNCQPSYRGVVYDARIGKHVKSRWLRGLSEARSWRISALASLQAGVFARSSPTTLREEFEKWLAGARSGAIRSRKRTPYRPRTLDGYESVLRLHLLPDLGGARLSDISLHDIQALADRLVLTHDASTVRNVLMPLRAVCRHAVTRSVLSINPTVGLELAAPQGRRDRIALPGEAAALIAALPLEDRGFWGSAFYAGLRRGEARGLRWEDVDTDQGVIRVKRSYDGREDGPPKSRAGRRQIPLVTALRDLLAERRAASVGDGLVFRGPRGGRFSADALLKRSYRIWDGSGLDRINLHEARHTFASTMIAARIEAKALSTYMGHSSIAVTYDIYGHLMPGNILENARRLDAYLVSAY